MAGLRHGPKLYTLSRNATQLWHLQRTQVTQLVQHERIKTTYAKAKALQYLARRVFKLGKEAAQKKPNSINRLMGILTTRFAVKKMINEIVPKFKDPHESIIKVVELPRRVSDSARMAYIEYNKNELQRYEQAALKEKMEKGLIPQMGVLNQRILKEELDYLKLKLDEAEKRRDSGRLNEISAVEIKRLEQDVRFFQRKIETVERDLWIENKNPLDLRRYFKIY